MNTLALNAQSPQPTATAESNNVAASDTQSSSDSSPVDTFLTLFVAEIQNQDPTDPTDATEYIDQLSCNQVNHLIPTRVLVKGGEITCKILK